MTIKTLELIHRLLIDEYGRKKSDEDEAEAKVKETKADLDRAVYVCKADDTFAERMAHKAAESAYSNAHCESCEALRALNDFESADF